MRAIGGLRPARLRLSCVFAPDRSGVVERDGVRIAYDVWSPEKAATVLLLPTWSIVHSRFWKLQVPYLARHFKVVAFDGRGSGRSDRPVGPAAYAEHHYADDADAVLGATGTARATVVGLSCGATYAVHLAARHPDRVAAVVALGPACGFGLTHPDRESFAWDSPLDTTRGWAKYNRDYWLHGNYDDFLRFFFAQMFSEPHSTKQIEDCVAVGPRDRSLDAGGHDRGPARLRRGRLHAGRGAGAPGCGAPWSWSTAPTTDPAAAAGRRLADLTGGTLVTVEGGGHGLQARDPVLVNLLVREVAERWSPPPAPRADTTWTRAASRPRRALYLSSPIGLGHARRDVAIARSCAGTTPTCRSTGWPSTR